MNLYVGIDLGTSSAKLVLMEENGQVRKQHSCDYRIQQPASGWKEIDPLVWYREVKMGLKILLNGDAKAVRGIGITGQMHTTVFLDKNGEPVHNAIMWNDIRTKKYIPGLKSSASEFEELSNIKNIISTGSPAANLLWLKENKPAAFRAMDKFLIGPDYLVYMFSGVYGTDFCEASTSSLYDIHKKEWSPVMRQVIGLTPELYPEVRASGTKVGKIKKTLAEELKLNEDVEIIAGTGDNTASAVSTGCLSHMYPVLSLGTSGALIIPKSETGDTNKGKQVLFSIEESEMFTLVQGAVQSVGSGYQWMVQRILGETDFENVTRDIDIKKTGENEILFYPHLVGDKTIYGDPELRGAFLGLSTDTRRSDMAVAVMEGIGFAVKELIDVIGVEIRGNTLKVTGGGSKSAIWMQILSDIVGIQIEQLEGNIGPAFGIAIITACSCEENKSALTMAGDLVKVKKRFLPRPYNSKLYAIKYKKYKKIYKALKYIYE